MDIILSTRCNILCLPDYLTTKIKESLLTTEILMSWSKKNVLVFSENISDAERAICEAKGWKYYIAQEIDVNILYSDIVNA